MLILGGGGWNSGPSLHFSFVFSPQIGIPQVVKSPDMPPYSIFIMSVRHPSEVTFNLACGVLTL